MAPDKYDMERGPIAWMASHPVAANLTMFIFLIAGFFLFTQTTREVFPTFSLDTITVQMSYPGASPEEVEQGIVLAIEDAVRDVDGIGEITSSAREGSGSVTIEVLDTEEIIRIAQDVKSATDRVTTFPVDAEDLNVKIDSRRRDVLSFALYGSVEERVLREAAEQIRDALEQDPEIGPVELSGARNYEIHIDVPQESLRRYGLTLAEIATIIRNTAVELGGGSLDTAGGEILVRMTERRDHAAQFGNIPIVTNKDGSAVLLRNIATISETFEDTDNFAFFNGKPAILFDIYRIGEQTPTGVADAVMERMDELNKTLPGDLKVSVTNNSSDVFRQRSELLLKNGGHGFILVVLFLALFLDARLALWVSMTIPVSFLGAFLFFPFTDFTINIISMFAFIITIGIVVDDAIVSGENIYYYRQKGLEPRQAAIRGAREVAVPVTISVCTNMLSFVPLLFMPGMMGKTFAVLPIVVMATFFVSLIDSLYILPYRLSFKKADKIRWGLFRHFIHMQKGFSGRFENFVHTRYGAFIHGIIRHRYLTLAVFVAVLIGFGGFVQSGRMGMQLFPRVESDYAFVAATLPVGAPLEKVQAVQKRLVDAAQQLVEENGRDKLSKGIYSRINGNEIEARIYLTEPEVRPLSTTELTNKWREKVGGVAGLDSLSFQANRGGPGSGAALTVELSHRDTEVLEQASIALAAELAEFPSTKDIDDGSAQGKRQYDFRMTELGHAAGLTTQEVARQVRASFHGSEVFKQQRGRNEVRVLVRLPEEQRSSEYYLDNLILRAPDGAEMMLREAVTAEQGRAYTAISRRDGRRVVSVAADVDPPSQAGQVIEAIKKDALPALQQRYPGLTYSFEGRQADIRDSLGALYAGMGLITVIMFALMAVTFSSYIQPLLVLIVIPFSAVGAVIGHLIMGYSLSVMSLFGMMALAGVVVNGSIVLIDFANRRRAENMTPLEAVAQAAAQRFRPIMLSNMTTFLGVAPMIFETSRQARFLIPMSLSLGFGILLATLVTLILLPALYMIVEDVKRLLKRGGV